jgi:transcription-repair coupling factor (superfamily II helicase)
MEKGGVLSFPGVATAAQPFFAALLRRLFPERTVVVVTEGLKTQESFQQDLTTWFSEESKVQSPKSKVEKNEASERQAASDDSVHAARSTQHAPLFYPAWEILPHESRLPHADVISERLETLVALASSAPRQPAPLVVTSVTALQQRTFAASGIRERTRTLTRGDRVDPLELVEWLEDQGYEPEAQVTQKGELSLRGGILDLFPLTSPWPARLEFFGDELESLRNFDPLTQLSRDEISAVTIPPGGELGILKKVQSPSSAVKSTSEDTKSKVQSPTGLATLLDHLPQGSIFLLCEPAQLNERVEEYERQVLADDPFFISWEEFLRQAEERGMSVIRIEEGDEVAVDAPGERESRFPQGENSPKGPAHCAPEPTTAANDSPSAREEGWGEGDRRVRLPGSPHAEADQRIHQTAVGHGEGLRFIGLDAYRPLAERAPEPQIAETQRKEFFGQLHRWSRQGYAVHVFCNNDGERQRFREIWGEYGLEESPSSSVKSTAEDGKFDDRILIHLGALARGFLSEQARVVVVTDAEIFGRYKVQRPRRLKSAHAQATRSALDIDFTELEEGDYVVHLQHGIGRYVGLQVLPIGAGTKPTEGGRAGTYEGQECLVIEYAPGEPSQAPPKLYAPVTEAHLVSKYVGTGKLRPPLNTLGGTRWAKAKAQAERAVRDVASELLAIQAARESQLGHAFAADSPWQREFEGSFIYEETPDQMKAIVETKGDMERPKPMDRLICGDVGFGKTEVGIRAAFKAVMDGRQVAVLVPTTVLAQQHYNTFRERMADYPVRIELLSRFRTRREQQRVVKDLAAGAVDIVIGTHRLLQNDISFKDLGLVVIDEEQRFGVMHKEKFKLLRKLVDVLTLSATPIPRTLYLALTGARDMSTIQTPPHDRLPVETIVTQYDERIIRDAIQRELNRGGQVFFLHNRVMTIENVAHKLRELLPQARIIVGHGQMDSDDLEEVMTTFVNGEADVLLSTTIIESGLDIPNANTIIIDRADRFGLSDLYQLRGRVGRYKHQAYAYLLLPRHGGLVADVRKRISAIKQYSTLGSGFKIAMRDLEIRGAGNLLGAQQSGHITAVGFELYCQLLKQSVSSLKGEKVAPRIEVQVTLDFLALSPVEESPKSKVQSPKSAEDEPEAAGSDHASRITPAFIPYKYISDSRQRIEIYRKLAQANDQAAVTTLERELEDRFGPIPAALGLLLQVAELKILAAERRIMAIEVKEDRLMLTRNNDFIMVGSKFPRLTKTETAARLKEIKKLLTVL